MVRSSADDVAALVTSVYGGLKFQPPAGQFTILAGFVLHNAKTAKVISLGSGSKCLPKTRLTKNGDALHDSHAEVLARRGLVRWLLEETGRICTIPDTTSEWIYQAPFQKGKFMLQPGVALTLYVSTLPCTSSINSICPTSVPH